ncbi:MAG: F0F1 ATP synthase subunit epsilon [Anaerolineae bacterium]|jgi:F0F1-type ATP synthase epsilon subunit|nr:F0F1 ATP synthase subunit epsilon [Anaerolineae bacterium]
MLDLTILTPEKTLLQVDDVRKVRLRLADGAWLSILPRHAPLLAETASGVVQYVTDGGEAALAISPGVVRVSKGRVLILTEQPEEAAVPDDVPVEAEALRFERLAEVLVTTLHAQREPGAARDEVGDVARGALHDVAEEV